MNVAILASVVVYFTGHMVVARPGVRPLPMVAFAPSDAMHEPLLLIRSNDLVSFTPGQSTLKLKGSSTPMGEPAVEIALGEWDVLIGGNEQPALTFQTIPPWEALTASRLVAPAAARMTAKAGTTRENAPSGIRARVYLKHDGVLDVIPATPGFANATWSCSPASNDCTYKAQPITDRLRWTSQGTPPTVALRHHGQLGAPSVTLKEDAQLWFVSRVVVDGDWPYASNSKVPHVPLYGLSLDYNMELPTIKLETIDVKPIFCPPIMAVRQE